MTPRWSGWDPEDFLVRSMEVLKDQVMWSPYVASLHHSTFTGDSRGMTNNNE